MPAGARHLAAAPLKTLAVSEPEQEEQVRTILAEALQIVALSGVIERVFVDQTSLE